MDTNQIYGLINDAVEMSMGSAELKAIDSSTLVSVGNSVLSSDTNTSAFLNVLVQRIGRTIFSYRAYRNSLSGMVMDDFEFGAIVQKTKVFMPVAEADETWELPEDGQSVDHYKITRPVVKQKFFVKRTPYRFKITIQEDTLKEAFLSESAMGGFLSNIFGELRNKIELTLETLGRATQTNFMANVAATANTINLVSDYNALTGKQLTAAQAFVDEEFLRYSVSRIKQKSKQLRDMRTDFNMDGYERHTPFEDQRLHVYSDFETHLEAFSEYAAFNKEYVSLSGFTEVNYWQAAKNPMKIQTTPETSKGKGTEVELGNIVAILYDRDAMGIYQQYERVATTPINAAALYYNSYNHQKQLWFNDFSENFVMFTLN